jgi:putative transposase
VPYRSSRNVGHFVFHVFNRAIESVVLFEQAGDYGSFVSVLRAAMERYPVRVLAYVVMPNHWHLIVWPDADAILSPFMQWLTETHARRWREWRETRGRGAVYQGRFKAVPIQRDGHLLRACLYVERNPLRKRLAARAEDWPWSSASDLLPHEERPLLSSWPVPKPADWLEQLNVPEPTRSLDEIRRSLRKGIPFGNDAWRDDARKQLSWLRGRAREPRGWPRSEFHAPVEADASQICNRKEPRSQKVPE